MIIEEETRVTAMPEEVFEFFQRVDEQYKAWQPDHRTFRWVEGDRLEEGIRRISRKRSAVN